MANTQQVAAIFLTLFNRVIDAPTSSKWQKEGEYGQGLINAILETPEGFEIRDMWKPQPLDPQSFDPLPFIQRVYKNALGKTNDTAGMNWWVEQVKTQGWSQAQFVTKFLEVVDHYRMGLLPSNEEEVKAVKLMDAKVALSVIAAGNLSKEVLVTSMLTFGSGLKELSADNAENMDKTFAEIQQQINDIKNTQGSIGGGARQASSLGIAGTEGKSRMADSDNHSDSNPLNLTGVHTPTDTGAIA